MSATSPGKLLVATLPIHPTKLETPIEWSKYANENADNVPVGETEFESMVYGDTFKFVEMNPEKDMVIV